MSTKMQPIKNKNLTLNMENTEKLKTFAISILKSNIRNKDTSYQALNISNLTNNKILRLITLYFSFFIKYIIHKIYLAIEKFIFLILLTLSVIIKIVINLFFNKFIRIKIFRLKIQNLSSRILYFKQISILRNLLSKRKEGVDPRLRKSRIKLIRKESFKKFIIKFIENKRKRKLKKGHKYMFTRKVRIKKRINKDLRSARLHVSEDFVKFLEIENNTFIFTKNLSNKLVSVLSNIKFILQNLVLVLRVFEKNKKINYAKKITEYILSKFNVFSKYLNLISKQLNTIKNVNKLFQFLFFRKFILLRSGRKSGKIYFKSFYKYYFFNSFLIILSFIKVVLLMSIVSKNDFIKNAAQKIDIFFNLDLYIKQFITNIRFI